MTQSVEPEGADLFRDADSVGDWELGNSFEGDGGGESDITRSGIDRESGKDRTYADESKNDEEGKSDAAEKDGEDEDEDEEDEENKDEDKDEEDEEDEENEENEDEDKSHRELTEAERYMKDKEERIAARKAMEESLAKQWGDLAKEFKKLSPKKRQPRKPKEPNTLPVRRSGRSKATSLAVPAPPPTDTETTSPHVPSTSQDPQGTADLPSHSSDVDRRNWPKWLRHAIDELADSADLAWTALLDKFLMLEKQLGYPTGMVGLDCLYL